MGDGDGPRERSAGERGAWGPFLTGKTQHPFLRGLVHCFKIRSIAGSLSKIAPAFLSPAGILSLSPSLIPFTGKHC